MAKDLSIIVEDRPGQAASVCATLGCAGINIDGTYGSSREGVVHVLVEDVGGVGRVLGDAGLRIVDERDVIVVNVEDRPGAAGEVLARLADEGINVDFYYLATGTRLVLGVGPLSVAAARTVLGTG